MKKSIKKSLDFFEELKVKKGTLKNLKGGATEVADIVITEEILP